MNEEVATRLPSRAAFWPIGFVLFVLVAACYVFLPDRHYRDDILIYSWAVETGEDLFHANHLLYTPIVRSLWLAQSAVNPEVRALDSANLLSLLFGPPAVVLFSPFGMVRPS